LYISVLHIDVCFPVPESHHGQNNLSICLYSKYNVPKCKCLMHAWLRLSTFDLFRKVHVNKLIHEVRLPLYHTTLQAWVVMLFKSRFVGKSYQLLSKIGLVLVWLDRNRVIDCH